MASNCAADTEDQNSEQDSVNMSSRPDFLPMNGSSSGNIISQTSQMSRESSRVENDSDGVDFEGYTERTVVSELMSELAAQDKDYDGLVVVTPSEKGLMPAPPTLWKDCWNVDCSEDGDDASKDGPHLSKAKKYLTLRLDRGQRDLSVYSNGRLLNQVVTTPGSQQAQEFSADLSKTCMFIYHNATPGASLLCLNPGQSPQLKPLYDPKKEDYSEIISYTEFSIKTSPGTIAVKVESETHVYLVLDYTDESHPKLVAHEEHVMEAVLKEMKSGKSEKKLKPIVNVRTYPHSEKFNNTAFYFKTEKDYYFVCVEADGVHLGVKKVPASAHTNLTYLQHLIFCPKTLDHCQKGESGMEDVDGKEEDTPGLVEKSSAATPPADVATAVKKTSIAASPTESVDSGQEGPEQPRKVSASSPESVPSNGSSPCGHFKLGSAHHGNRDSGLGMEAKCGRESCREDAH